MLRREVVLQASCSGVREGEGCSDGEETSARNPGTATAIECTVTVD